MGVEDTLVVRVRRDAMLRSEICIFGL